ncbi:fibroblast growth factor receptor [Culex quinquefasciatus]|uniref:receptor protein-tyrosine kinase n=1 Tax=Culex quinquefasciatus TaxID=7176 RepID=B0XF29_CULQU|nr:fibroblast growth factor receptor [Culex quinquefasciatus]|eukprot:XP_001868251.1 fibroblast growth factor receptor [Culex quinquefasciatus]
MPSIRIESKRSIEVVNDDFGFAPVLEYEFPIDWDFEFPREKLTLGKKLGKGAFGKVFMAYADGLLQEGVTSTVAVKMLKDEYSDTEVLDLVCELEIMKIVGKHPNGMNLLGSCAQYGPLYVIMEFAVHGNLKDFLRGHTLKTEDDLHGAKTLTMKQLVAFGLQIAAGMQYLSSLKFIHRDLAARNILVSEGFTMKITNFGLARDVHNQDYYRKKTSGKLPIRWMAPESLEERFFDTKTDVWSFGVLLWEIITFGRTPYGPAFSWEHLLEFLKQGNRLEKPENCPDGLYNIMRECWQFEARERPTFDQLRASIDRLIDNFEESSGYRTLVDSESVV